jgi:hypothetical protein
MEIIVTPLDNGSVKASANKCDLCLTRPHGPACIENCPADVLTLATPAVSWITWRNRAASARPAWKRSPGMRRPSARTLRAPNCSRCKQPATRRARQAGCRRTRGPF